MLNRENYSAYLNRRIDSLEKTVLKVESKYAGFEKLAEENRLAEEQDVKNVMQWIIDERQKDAKFQQSLDMLKAQLPSKSIDYQKDIDLLQAEMQKMQSTLVNYKEESTQNYMIHLEKIDDDVLEKLRGLTKSVDEIKNMFTSPSNANGKDYAEMKLLAEWIVREEAKDEQVQKDIELLKMDIHKQRQENLSGKSLLATIEEEFHVWRMKLNQLNAGVDRRVMEQNNLPVQGRVGETRMTLELQGAIDKLRVEMERQREQINGNRIDHETSIQSINKNFQTLRVEIEDLCNFRDTVIDRMCYLRSQFEEIEYYSKDMFAKQEDQEKQIAVLIDENETLRENQRVFEFSVFEEMRLLREEMRQMKESKNGEKKEQPQVQQVDKVLDSTPESSQVEMDDDIVLTESFSFLADDNEQNASIQIINEVLAQWKQEDLRVNERLEKKHTPRKSVEEIPIEEAIVGEWKWIKSENVRQFCDRNKWQKHEVCEQDMKITIVGNKLTTYYYKGGSYVKAKCKLMGNPDSLVNFWHVENDCVKSVDFMGFSSKTNIAERCMRYLRNGQLVMTNEIGGTICTRFYEKIC